MAKKNHFKAFFTETVTYLLGLQTLFFFVERRGRSSFTMWFQKPFFKNWPMRVKKFPLIFRVTDRVGINESGFLTIVRLGRVLRPLRAINRVPSMSILDLSYVLANHVLHINNKAMKVRGKSLQRKICWGTNFPWLLFRWEDENSAERKLVFCHNLPSGHFTLHEWIIWISCYTFKACSITMNGWLGTMKFWFGSKI